MFMCIVIIVVVVVGGCTWCGS